MGEREIRKRLSEFCAGVDKGRVRTRMHRLALQKWLMPPLVGAAVTLGAAACESDPEPDVEEHFISDYIAPWDDDGQEAQEDPTPDYTAPWEVEEYINSDYMPSYDWDAEDADESDLPPDDGDVTSDEGDVTPDESDVTPDEGDVTPEN